MANICVVIIMCSHVTVSAQDYLSDLNTRHNVFLLGMKGALLEDQGLPEGGLNVILGENCQSNKGY